MIYEFDDLDTLEIIKDNHLKISALQNSLIDNISAYRTFFGSIGTSFPLAKEVISKSEYSLLIDCYTFSERLLKNTIYECLSYRKHKNNSLNLFLQKKINPEKFSPNVKFKEFESELISLSNNFKFLLSENHYAVRIYNELVKSRHRYAHSNEYPFAYENYGDAIVVLEYLQWECSMFIQNQVRHGNLLLEYNSIIDCSKKLKKISNNKKLRYLTKQEAKNVDLKKFRKDVRRFLKIYKTDIENLTIFEQLIVCLVQISELNFNTSNGNDLSNICTNLGSKYH
jgi:hypothetical protein